MPVKDSMIAATALHNGFAIATRNIRGYRKTGVDLINPFRQSGRSVNLTAPNS